MTTCPFTDRSGFETPAKESSNRLVPDLFADKEAVNREMAGVVDKYVKERKAVPAPPPLPQR